MRPGETRTQTLQRAMAEAGLDAFVLFDPDSIFYFGEVWDYLGMEFGRATLMVVPRQGRPTLITPFMESEMARRMTWLEGKEVVTWMDGVDGEWMKPLVKLIGKKSVKRVGIEWEKTHPSVHKVLASAEAGIEAVDSWRIISRMRMVKTPAEIQTMREAGEVAVAMVVAGKGAIAEGVPEYELALACIAGGTRKAGEILLRGKGKDPLDQFFSPTIYNLQVLQSGQHTCMVHRRSTIKPLRRGDGIYFCYCGIANFKGMKLGFDRMFFVKEAEDGWAHAHETAVKAQQTALQEVKPGAIAEDVNAAAVEIYKSGGYGASYRTGRGVGFSFLEEPQLKVGDRTRLEPGMTFAVDGGVTVAGKYGGRIGDSIVVTERGFEYLTPYPRGLAIVA